MFGNDFYPTPPILIEKLIDGMNLRESLTILEPSAGKGDIVEYIRGKKGRYSSYNIEIDTIEIEPNLQHILRGKGYPVVHDDFLTFTTSKRYSLVVANFPFSDGDKHLQKALSLLETHGGALACIVNAETLRNPYTNLRKALVAKLESYNASIEYLSQQFTEAERKTDVNVAVIRLTVPEPTKQSVLLDRLEKAEEVERQEQDQGQLIDTDFIKAMVARFNTETRLGLSLIREYKALTPLLLERMPKPGEKDPYNDSIIKLRIGRDGKYSNYEQDLVNDYLKELRHKYWRVLIGDGRFTSRYTSNILRSLSDKLETLKGYDFSEFNIEQLQNELNTNLVTGIEDAIMKLFDELAGKYAYHDEFGDNIHYYNGWKANKAHKINNKVILPMNGFSSYSFSGRDKLDNSYIRERLQDMVKALNYLAGDLDDSEGLVDSSIEHANGVEKFRHIDFYYFDATFFKKGTCHIIFKDQKLLDKFNIFGARKRGWLPPSYGRKAYKDMGAEERRVVDEFQGAEEYATVMEKTDYYIVESDQLLLEGAA